MEKMTMTGNLAKDLYDALCCVAVSALGGLELIDGVPSVSDSNWDKVIKWADNAFSSLLADWVCQTGKEWDIEEVDEPEEPDEDCFDEPADLEMGFNPYEGGYDFDC